MTQGLTPPSRKQIEDAIHNGERVVMGLPICVPMGPNQRAQLNLAAVAHGHIDPWIISYSSGSDSNGYGGSYGGGGCGSDDDGNGYGNDGDDSNGGDGYGNGSGDGSSGYGSGGGYDDGSGNGHGSGRDISVKGDRPSIQFYVIT